TNKPNFVERNKAYRQFVSYLTQNFNIDKEDADEFAKQCVMDTKAGKSPNEMLRHLSEVFEFDSLDAVKKCMGYLVELMNNTREWALKGHTSLELSPADTASLQPTPNSQQKQTQPITVT